LAQELKIKGKRVSIHGDGSIFVDGKDTNLKRWSSCATRYSNRYGQEQTDLKGMKLEDALYVRGFVPGSS